ncbi:hypothetical protein NHX12_006942 [Muraenolepis orangiensis]|uniref:Protein kinase domain-containing protein n=1 Tax=Muraenolepis orangiensis TaxID=630683 RepID=A0A9Q0DN71_9TELE|nr:hypothetical protein NHX12_006942 [Muraenolepis orangiensis]
MTMENYLVLGNLGEGSFGKVWKCRPKNSSGRHVAVKEYLDCNIERNITREIMPLTRLRHHNLLKAFGWFVEWGKLFGVFELMDHDLMSELSGGYMGHDALRKYTFQILLGTHFLHSRDRCSLALMLHSQIA